MMQNRHRKVRKRYFLRILFLCSLIFCVWLSHIPFSTGQVVNAQTPDASKLVQQGVERYQTGDWTGAIKLWETALSTYEKTKNLPDKAIVWENLARTYPEIGEMQQSLTHWDKVVAYYRQVGDIKQLGRSLTEQAQVYNNIGQPQKAIALLCNSDIDNNCTSGSALFMARTVKDEEGEAAALGSLGDTYRLRGDYKDAIEKLKLSLKLAQKLRKPAYLVSATNSLGNAHNSLALFNYRRVDLASESGDTANAPAKFREIAKKEDANALSYFQQSLELARNNKDVRGEMQVLRSLIPVYYRTNNITSATTTLQQSINLLERLPSDRTRVYATIDLVRLLPGVTQDGTTNFSCINKNYPALAESLLNQAVNIAENIKDFRAKSFAQGQLGHLYECRKQYAKALEITEQARWSAEQGLKARDSLYLWEWQTGRILKAVGKKTEAISAYERAIDTLDSIRQNILTADRDVQFDFRDTIEPIYRNLVELRLSLEPPEKVANKSMPSKKNGDKNDNFGSVLKTIDSLKLAELQNFFGNECIINALRELEVVSVADQTTAVFSTVILEDKTAVILSLPKGKKYNWYNTSRENLVAEINEFRRGLQRFRKNYNTEPGKHIYDWMIAPFAEDLNSSGIKTLVFIHDGILRSVPMAALYDSKGKKFLIEEYAIATTPSLSLTDPKPMNRKNLRVLALGLSEPSVVDGVPFPPLNYVEQEIAGVQQQIPGKKLSNDEFTSDRLKQELSQEVYPIIHLATHGKFGTDPEDTFIVMGNKNDKGENQTLTFYELDRLIRSVTRNTEPMELLTLTACETAVGNDRSALGLAGIAIQAGAKSALASLWAINDAATAQFATDFYTKLLSDSSMSKAEVLQAVQLEFIHGKALEGRQYTHPAYWSPFVLIGNWL
ncbi:MAG: CHAT domain-containing protein [Scytonema sp. PMC 1069.18]|nr:CHAT domain-containing protein [Scytonema sp. PMC 1069.18]MEC4882571.1 CHAT domain-containing protein [Scytonema sp. PMC 1070.18]